MTDPQNWQTEEYKGMDVHVTALPHCGPTSRWDFTVRVTDPECPFRLVRREIFQHLPIQSGGPFVQVEILAKANHLSCYLAEEPVTWTPPFDATTDAISFGQDARLVFHHPDFGTHGNPQRTPEPTDLDLRTEPKT